MVAKVREKLAVIKQAAQKFNVERFNHRKLSELEVRKQYQIKISNRFAALENLSGNKDINRAWENLTVNIKISSKQSLDLYELKQHKPWLDEERLGFSDKRKQTEMQWVQEPSPSNVDNLDKVRREASRHSRNKKRDYSKAKIDELVSSSKIKNIIDLYRGINGFKKGYRPGTNIVEDEKGDLVSDSVRWRNHFSQLFNVHRVNDVRRIEI